jgi:hypothetical protein
MQFSLASFAPSLDDMPSAIAIAMPFVASNGCSGTSTPCESSLRSLRPAIECWPMLTAGPS